MLKASVYEQLKSRYRTVRCQAIDKLVREGSDEAVSALLRVSQGKKRNWIEKYDSQDQMYALEALSKTGDEQVIKFLTRFFTEEITDHPQYQGGPDDWAPPKWVIVRHTYPHARGELADRLCYEEQVEAIGHPQSPSVGGYRKGKVERSEGFDLKAHHLRNAILKQLQVKT